MFYIIDIDGFTLQVKCFVCDDHTFWIDYDKDNTTLGWYTHRKDYTLWQRIKEAWRTLRGKSFYDEICLDSYDVIKLDLLRKYFNLILEDRKIEV